MCLSGIVLCTMRNVLLGFRMGRCHSHQSSDKTGEQGSRLKSSQEKQDFLILVLKA